MSLLPGGVVVCCISIFGRTLVLLYFSGSAMCCELGEFNAVTKVLFILLDVFFIDNSTVQENLKYK